jgi:hypothetical protein
MMSAPPDRKALLGKSFSLRKAAGDRGLVGPKQGDVPAVLELAELVSLAVVPCDLSLQGLDVAQLEQIGDARRARPYSEIPVPAAFG